MDFANAALLVVVIYSAVETVDRALGRALPNGLASWQVPLLAIAVGIGIVFLVADTVWAAEQVIGKHGLDTLNASSKVVAGGMGGLLAVGFDQGLKTVKNIGQNQ